MVNIPKPGSVPSGPEADMSIVVEPAAGQASPSAGHRVLLAILLTVIGLGALAVSLLGPLVLGLIEYHASAGAVGQVRGGDVAGLLLVAPTALASAVLSWRGRRGAEALAVAPAGYGLYMYAQLAVGGDIARYDGNSERWFVLFWVLVTTCAAVLVVTVPRVLRDAAPTHPRRLERFAAWYLLVVALFLFVGLHLPGLADAWRAQPTSAEYLADPVVFWMVKLMDLAFVVPGAAAVGVGLLRSRGWATRLLAPMIGWSALLASSVAGMAVVMLATGGPGASAGLTIGFVGFAAVAIGLAVAAYRPVLSSRGTRGRRGERGR